MHCECASQTVSHHCDFSPWILFLQQVDDLLRSAFDRGVSIEEASSYFASFALIWIHFVDDVDICEDVTE